MEKVSDIQAAINAGTQAVQVLNIEGTPTVIAPRELSINQFEELLPAPLRLKESVTLLDAISFIDYYNEFSTDDSLIFVNLEKGIFKAILDYHKLPDQPTWGSHTASYTCPNTEEWKRWNDYSGTKMDQIQFALFIEDNLLEITQPSGGEMLEIATTLRAKTKVDFSSATRLDNGQTQLSYLEDMEGKAGLKGQLEIPETIKLKLQPFIGGPMYECEARFRYRIKEGQLIMWYDLVRPHRIHEDAVKDVFDQIKQAKRGGNILMGICPR